MRKSWSGSSPLRHYGRQDHPLSRRHNEVASIGIFGGEIATIGGGRLIIKVHAGLAKMEPLLIRAFDELILTLYCDAVFRLVRTQSDLLGAVIMGQIYRLLVALEPRSLK